MEKGLILIKNMDDFNKIKEIQDLLTDIYDRQIEIFKFVKMLVGKLKNNLKPITTPIIFPTMDLDNANPYESSMYNTLLQPNYYILYIANVAIKSFICVYKFESSKNSEELNTKYWLLIAILDILIFSNYKRYTYDTKDLENIRISKNNNLLSALKDKNNYPEELEPLTENDLNYLNKNWYPSGICDDRNIKITNSKELVLGYLAPILDDEEFEYIYKSYDNIKNIQLVFKYDLNFITIQFLDVKTNGELCSIEHFLSEIYNKYNLYATFAKIIKKDMSFKPETEYYIDSEKDDTIKIIIKLYCQKYMDESK